MTERASLTFHHQQGSQLSLSSSPADSREHSELVPNPHLTDMFAFINLLIRSCETQLTEFVLSY